MGIDSASDPDQEYIYFVGIDSASDPDQEYIYFMGLKSPPSACYILSDESSIPFYNISVKIFILPSKL